MVFGALRGRDPGCRGTPERFSSRCGMRWVRWDAMGAVGCCRRAAAEISGITGHRAKEANGGV